MGSNDFGNIIERSVKIRNLYHQLERQMHGTEWTVEEDALAFLTDAGLVGRLTMSQQERWLGVGNTASDLEHKLSECIWWLIILARRMDIDIDQALDEFLSKLEKQF
jgi:hypothetical protein